MFRRKSHAQQAGAGLAGDAGWRRSSVTILLIWLSAAAGVLSAAYWYQSQFEEQYVHGQAEQQLSAIADLKVEDLRRYRASLMWSALTIHRNAAFSELAQQFLEHPDRADSRGRLREWMGKFRGGFTFDRLSLLDAQGQSRLTVPDGPPDRSALIAKRAAQVARTSEIHFEDFYRSEDDQKVYLSILVPVLAAPDYGKVLGVVSFRIDPDVFLYPEILRWPTPSRTAETLLVRREGDEVVYLNEVRMESNAALTLRFPLYTANVLPAAMAVTGRSGIVRGQDYRGQPVLAALRPVPDSPWFMVARVDLAEVYAPVRERFRIVVVLSGTILLGSMAGMMLLRRGEQARALERSLAAAQSLREADRRYRLLFENSSQGISLNEMVYAGDGTPVDYRILDANPAFAKQTGIPAGQIAGRAASEVLGCSPPPHLEHFERAAGKGESSVFEDFVPSLHRHLRISVMSPKQGFFNTMVENISDRIRRDEELHRKNEEMERFTYTVSHDLRSPLVTIETFLGFLQRDMAGNDAGQVEKDLMYVRDAAGKMSRLIDHLADISRVGRIINPATCVSHRELVDEVLASLAGRILESRVDVRVTGGDVKLHADRVRLAEIWQNLIENALKYMGGQVTPCIEIGMEGAGPDTVFSVRDNGMGIDPRYLNRVFNLFEKLDPKSQGTGFGLALVRRIVELYEGRVWAESEGLGRGTCFRFTLPLAFEEQLEHIA